MSRTELDIDDNESLDGADLADHALKPDDDDEPNQCRTRQNPRAAVRGVPKVRRDEQRPKRARVARRG